MVKGANERGSFLDFWLLESKFINFLMSALKWQVNSTSNFALFFIVLIHNSSVNFKIIHFLPIKVRILTLSSALVKICQISHVIFSNYKLVFLQILHHSSVSWKITPVYFFSSNIIYFRHKEPIKTNFRLSSSWVKSHRIPSQF